MSERDAAKPARKRKWKWIALIVGVLAVVIGALHIPTGPVKIEIGPDTTVIDGPLNPDGTVNYVAALDAECAKGITPRNNAAILILRAIGPEEYLPEETRHEILARLEVNKDGLATRGQDALATFAADCVGKPKP